MLRVGKIGGLAAVTSAMPAVQVASECTLPKQTVNGVGQHFSSECGPVDLKCNAFRKRYMAVHIQNVKLIHLQIYAEFRYLHISLGGNVFFLTSELKNL